MSDKLIFRFDVDGDDFTSAGQASVQMKKNLRQLGIDSETIKRVSIAMYEGEINMVIHAGGGVAEVSVSEDAIEIVLDDKGPGIADIERAMLDIDEASMLQGKNRYERFLIYQKHVARYPDWKQKTRFFQFRI